MFLSYDPALLVTGGTIVIASVDTLVAFDAIGIAAGHDHAFAHASQAIHSVCWRARRSLAELAEQAHNTASKLGNKNRANKRKQRVTAHELRKVFPRCPGLFREKSTCWRCSGVWLRTRRSGVRISPGAPFFNRLRRPRRLAWGINTVLGNIFICRRHCSAGRSPDISILACGCDAIRECR